MIHWGPNAHIKRRPPLPCVCIHNHIRNRAYIPAILTHTLFTSFTHLWMIAIIIIFDTHRYLESHFSPTPKVIVCSPQL